jgi:hypothetical protein
MTTTNINSYKNSRLIGIILFLIGGVAAISAAAKSPAQVGGFPDTMGLFAGGMALGLVGLLLWRKNDSLLVKESLTTQSNDKNSVSAIDLLKSSVAPTKKLVETISTLENKQICVEVDKILDECILPFVDQRKTFTDILGLEKGSELLLDMAYTERMFNRTWSAASDDHKPEAISSLNDAYSALQVIESKLKELKL